jgi:hypothetical protein
VRLSVARLRIGAQQIARHDFRRPKDVVAWLGAVQAQDYAGAKWALGARLPDGVTDASIERALDQGEMLRTHAMRWTWQLVAPEDVRWIVELVAPRLMQKAARRHRELELDAKTIAQSNAAIGKALAEAPLTRAELAAVLRRARVAPDGQRLPHLLACAELACIATSGPRRGKQHTWTLLDERAPRARRVDPRDAAAELAFRWARSRGPATADDFAWWSGLPSSVAREALQANAHRLASETLDGRTLWFDAKARAGDATCLLPAFDELLVGYRVRDDLLDPSLAKRINAGGGMLAASILAGDRIVGTWRRELAGARVVVAHSLDARVGRDELARATRRYAAFLERAYDEAR